MTAHHLRRFQGRMEYRDIGTGAWVLITPHGEQYHVVGHVPPPGSRDRKVEVAGRLRRGGMSMAAVDGVLEAAHIHLA